jgi:hypothetical protein
MSGALLLLSVPLTYLLDLLRIEQLYLVAALAGAGDLVRCGLRGLPAGGGRARTAGRGNSKLSASGSVPRSPGRRWAVRWCS